MVLGKPQKTGLVKAGACGPRIDVSVALPLKALPTGSMSFV